MLDKIVMWIPIDASLVDASEEGRYSIFNFDLLDLGLKVGSYDVFKDEDGNVKQQVLHHAWSKIPTSHTKMSFKFFHEGYNHPYVELKASPAKILQGHNVYGSDWIEQGALEMLGYFAESEPTLFGMCHIGGTEVKLLDATYSFRFKDDREAEKVRELLRNVSTQHIRKSTKDASFKNTVYFGSERGKHYKRKAYVKSTEFKEQLEEQIKLAKANDLCAQRVVKVMSCPELQKWAIGLLRFETGITAYTMKQQGIPTNLFQLIRYQRANPSFLQDQWLKANHQLFKAFEGTNVKVSDHETVFKNILAVHKTVSTEKKICTRKVDEMMNFYLCLENLGALALKEYSSKRYLNLKADLIDAGFSASLLQRLHENPSQNFSHFDVYIQLFKAFKKEIPAGTVSDRKARNLHRFYDDIAKYGFEEMKTKYSAPQFRKLTASLRECGFSQVYLQNLHVQSSNNIIPFINMFEMKFDQQVPENFVEPVSTFNKRQLKLVS